MKRFHLPALLAALLTASLVGCSRGPQTAKLTGKVFLGKKALKVADIAVYSEDGKERGLGAVVSEDGTYVVENAPLGKVKIAVKVPDPKTLPPQFGGGGPARGKKPPLPEGVPSPEGPAPPDLPPELKATMDRMLKAAVPISPVYADPATSQLTTTVEPDRDNTYNIVLLNFNK